jgi:hypothetical protein
MLYVQEEHQKFRSITPILPYRIQEKNMHPTDDREAGYTTAWSPRKKTKSNVASLHITYESHYMYTNAPVQY